MFYVMSDPYGECVAEFATEEEAVTYVEAHNPDELWISTDEDDEPYYNEDEGFDPYMGDYSWDC